MGDVQITWKADGTVTCKLYKVPNIGARTWRIGGDNDIRIVERSGGYDGKFYVVYNSNNFAQDAGDTLKEAKELAAAIFLQKEVANFS